jgi:hypothetical protein
MPAADQYDVLVIGNGEAASTWRGRSRRMDGVPLIERKWSAGRARTLRASPARTSFTAQKSHRSSDTRRHAASMRTRSLSICHAFSTVSDEWLPTW